MSYNDSIPWGSPCGIKTLSLMHPIPWGKGYGRFHYQENIQFCRQALGSLYEVFDHLTVAFDEEYLEESVFEKYKKRIFNIIKLINGYIKYLKTKKDSDNSS